MTPSELKAHVEEKYPRFFDRKTMRFFGDTMQNYGVRKTVILSNRNEQVTVWELYRKHPVKYRNQESAFFCCETFERVFPMRS